MVLKLYGHPFSTCTKRVMTVLEETKFPYEFMIVDVASGAQKKPGFLTKEPFGQVTYLEDNGFIVYEFRAIARYFAAKAASPLLPTGDATKAALFEQAASTEVSNFDPFATGITFQRVLRVGTEAYATELATMLEGKLAGYDFILAKTRYLVGDELTLADFFHLPYGMYLAPQKFTFLENEAKFANAAR